MERGEKFARYEQQKEDKKAQVQKAQESESLAFVNKFQYKDYMTQKAPLEKVTGAVRGRQKKTTQRAEPVEGASGGGFPKTPIVQALGRALKSPHDSRAAEEKILPVAGRTRAKAKDPNQEDVTVFFLII